MGDDGPIAKRKVFAFKNASVRILPGDENSNRIIHLPGLGGVAALRDSVYPYVYGHVKFPPRDEDHADLLRKVALTVWTRTDDPTPLSLAAGYDGRYQGARLTKEEQDRLRSNTTRTAIADHKRKGTQKSQVVKLMIIALILAIAIAGLTWLAVPLIAIFK